MTNLPTFLRACLSVRTACHACVVAGLLVSVSGMAFWTSAHAQSAASIVDPNPAPVVDNAGPVRLRQAGATPAETERQGKAASPDGTRAGESGSRRSEALRQRAPNEFELYVRKLAGVDAIGQPVKIQRFGSEFLYDREHPPSMFEDGPNVPADYVIGVGDEILLTLWGSVDADLRFIVDRSGRISIPRVGTVSVQGVRYADLHDVLHRRVAQVFRNFQLSTSLGRLRGIRVFVTGFVDTPGPMTVSSLSSVLSALLRAGGPSASGSFRNIQLRRGGNVATTVDFYEFLLKGNRQGDRTLQPDDVIHVGPVGAQVALIGSVNRPGVFELKPGESLQDVLQMAGGLAPVADTTRLAIERLDERDSTRITQVSLPSGQAMVLKNGDVLRAFNTVTATLPVARQNKRVRIEGEVAKPGEYVLAANSTIRDALAAAGGKTPSAFIYGTEFQRESVRVTQQENYNRALRDLETDITRNTSTRRTSTGDEVAARAAQEASSSRLIENLRSIRPTGRVVLQLQPDSADLPDIALEDGDRIYIPPRPTTVGVFGSVYSAGSYLFDGGRLIEDYLRLAGGPTRGADMNSVFVIHVNGSVSSNLRAGNAWFSPSRQLVELRAGPGDTIFVPEELDKTTFVQSAKDWTQIIYQFGLGIAGVKALGF